MKRRHKPESLKYSATVGRCGATRKRCFRTEAAARDFIIMNGNGLVRAYRCQFCNFYHVTSKE